MANGGVASHNNGPQGHHYHQQEPSVAQTKAKQQQQSAGLPDMVAHVFYKHGLFLTSYPTCATSIAIVAILSSCYPLINIPLPGTIPTKIVLPFDGRYSLFPNDLQNNITSSSTSISLGSTTSLFGRQYSIFGGGTANVSYEPPLPWAQSSPILYVQQITLRTSVLPWSEEMQLMDAFRAPLYEVFKLLEIVRNHQTGDNPRTLEQICLHVDNVKRAQHEHLFPEYGCLVLSPANLWSQNVQNFARDTNILNTIFQYHNLQKSKVSAAEMLFGLPLQDTGLKRYPLRSRSRIIQYAITLILKQNDQEYLKSLKEKLLQYYPPPIIDSASSQSSSTTAKPAPLLDSSTASDLPADNADGDDDGGMKKSSITYIFYPGEFKILEFLPICLAFVSLYAYVYFSVRKIEIIRSRVLLAFCAVLTVLGSLVMSLGCCFFFGLTISLHSKDVFPYLVILVGLENCLVITKSIVSTDETFDVKIRVAQALSKEGWHFSKTLLTEITILTIGLGTFVPVIQEFCVFAIVGLLSDFMLQMLLFSTILAMNIKRTEYTTEAKHLPKMMFSCTMAGKKDTSGTLFPAYTSLTNQMSYFTNSNSIYNATAIPASPSIIPSRGGGGGGAVGGSNHSHTFHRSQSHPKLAFADLNTPLIGSNPADISKRASIQLNANASKDAIPKRLKIVNFWARTRFFQRAFMIWMSVWIASILYNSGYLENLFIVDSNQTAAHHYESSFHSSNFQSNDRGFVSNFFNNVQSVLHSAAAATSAAMIRAHAAKRQQSQMYNPQEHQGEGDVSLNTTESDLKRLLYPDFELNYFLSNFHWSTIMKQYNISLSGRYVTILPTIKLSQAISPEVAMLIRNPNEKLVQNFQWKALAAALDPLDFNDDENRDSPIYMPGGTPLFPKSPMEIFCAIMLCCISIFVLCYTMVVFYRCICTRNYAEWRSSWNETSEIPQKTEQILEGVPSQIVGHKHRIECLVSDGSYIISCCLKGQIKVWDTRSGENITTINRNDMQINETDQQHTEGGDTAENDKKSSIVIKKLTHSPIWCLDYFDNLIAVGCANGRIELWETPSGILKCIYHEDTKANQGITHIHLNGDKAIVARLSGRLEIYRLETYYKGRQIDWGFTSAYRRTHVRTSSTGSLGLMMQNPIDNGNDQKRATNEKMKCTLMSVRLAHQQPITCLEVVNNMVFTGSQDHTLKVYSLNNVDIEYTLHGHCGPITCLFVDRWQVGTGGSGSQDGLLCVWDLFTGTCMYNIQAHDGAISCLVCAPSYVISLGTDERICVWEKFQGNLLTTINISNPYSSLLMLTPSLLVSSKMGSLIVWDVRTGEPAREVKLDFSNQQLCPKFLMMACDSVVCDYGNEIRVVRFPIVADKCH